MAKDPSKTEKATPKRRDKAREEGNVPKGMELGKSVVLIAGFVALVIFIGSIGQEMKVIFAWFFRSAPTFQVTPESTYALFMDSAARIAHMTLPSMAVMAVAAFVTQRLQVGALWSMKAMQPKFKKVFDVLGGIKRLFFEPKVFVQLIKNVLMAVAIGIAPYIVLKEEIGKVAPLFYANAEGVAVYILTAGAKMVLYALVPMLVIAIADTFYTRWDYEENLKMSKDEVKDENKQQEGDPEVKGQQRKKMMDSMSKRMLQDVPKADVVITNPTHIAIAIMYNAMQAPAPIIVAMGADHMAEKIKETAREAGVPIRENKPLARALYKSVEVGEMIPEEMYQAVATILAGLQQFKRNN